MKVNDFLIRSHTWNLEAVNRRFSMDYFGISALHPLRGRIREEPLSDPPPDRKTRDRRAGAGFLHLLAVVPLDHLQGAVDRKGTRLKSSHSCASRMPSSARKTIYIH